MAEDLSETLSTIRFAQGAKTLKNNPQINVVAAELKAKERARTPGKNYVPGGLRNRNLNAKTPKSAKRPAAAGAGSSVKKVHSNTFCTPSKIRKLDYGKLNTTIAPVPFQKPAPPPPEPVVMVAPPTRAALQQMMPPPAPFPRFSDVTERDFDCIPSDCRSSMLSLNLSSSTSVDAPVTASSLTTSGVSSQVSSYSPIVKKCMETFEATIEQKLAQMFEKIQHIAPAPPAPQIAAIPATPVAPQQPITVDCTDSQQPAPTPSASGASAIPWDMIRREIQEAIRSEMSTINESHHKYETSTPCRSTVNESRLAAPPATVKLVNPALQRVKATAVVAADDSLGEGGDLDGTVVMNTKTPRRYEVISVDSEEEEEDDEEGVVVRRRISKRLSGEVRQPLGRIDANVGRQVAVVTPKTVQVMRDESVLWEVKDNGQVRRRSTRISERKSAVHVHSKKGCCPSTKKKKQQRFEPLLEEAEADKENEGHVTMRKKAVPMTISNKVIAGYFQTPGAGGKKDARMTASKHGKAVLDLVNRGSIKEVQILPTVGLKMAYQIVTHRTINGKFKKIDDLAKLFVGGKKWTKFLEANYLS
uniref:Kinesin motor domain-containing protein n=2 Tax=Culex tarsalis TaxID=7177 RepID=A0A1Q3FVS5_CULTA